MQGSGVAPNAIALNTVLSVGSRCAQWELVLALLNRMADFNVHADAVSFNTVLNACERAQTWVVVLQLLAQLRGVGLKVPNLSLQISGFLGSMDG